MSDTPRTLTLRRVEHGELKAEDCTLNEVFYPGAFESDDGPFYRVVNPIPEGYEECDLADATKVLIGETWIEKMSGVFTCGGLQLWPFRIEGLGVLAIRPIPEPEPMKGEADVHSFDVTHGFVSVPVDLIGKRVRWEVIE